MMIWKKIQQFQRETRVIADAMTLWHSSLALQLDDLHQNRSKEINQLLLNMLALHILMIVSKKIQQFQRETRVIADAMTLWHTDILALFSRTAIRWFAPKPL